MVTCCLALTKKGLCYKQSSHLDVPVRGIPEIEFTQTANLHLIVEGRMLEGLSRDMCHLGTYLSRAVCLWSTPVSLLPGCHDVNSSATPHSVHQGILPHFRLRAIDPANPIVKSLSHNLRKLLLPFFHFSYFPVVVKFD